MFMIGVPKDEIPLLTTTGVQVRINRKATVLRKVGTYLCYKDGAGAENRCKIMSETSMGTLIHYACKSHGMDTEDHVIIGPDGDKVY